MSSFSSFSSFSASSASSSSSSSSSSSTPKPKGLFVDTTLPSSQIRPPSPASPSSQRPKTPDRLRASSLDSPSHKRTHSRKGSISKSQNEQSDQDRFALYKVDVPPGVTLPPDTFLANDGHIYDIEGVKIGRLQVPKPPVEGAHIDVLFDRIRVRTPKFIAEEKSSGSSITITQPSVDASKYGMETGHQVDVQGHVFDEKNHYIGHIENWKEIVGAQSHSERIKATFKDGFIFVNKDAIGTLREGGNVVDFDGKNLGSIAPESLKTLREKKENLQDIEVKIPTTNEIISDLLFVPDYFTSELEKDTTDDADKGDEKGGLERTESMTTDQDGSAQEQWRSIDVEEDKLITDKEPAVGVLPHGFNLESYNQSRNSRPAKVIIPSRFTKAPLPRDYPTHEKIMTHSALQPILESHNFSFGFHRQGPQQGVQPTSIKLCYLKNLDKSLTLDQFKNLGRILSRMTNLRILGLVESNLKHVNNLVLPFLLRLDLNHNMFKKTTDIVHMIHRSPLLQRLDLTDNPVTDGWADSHFLPPIRHPFWSEVILSLSDLEVLNGKIIPNSLRAEAFARVANDSGRHARHLQQHVPMLIWQNAINSLPAIKSLPEWTPSHPALKYINLSNQGLSEFHVKVFSGVLEVLNLSNNIIQSSALAHSGITTCSSLKALDLRNNKLTELTHDSVLYGQLPSLTGLNLEGNMYGINYQSAVIFATRNLRGSNRAPGLIELDGRKISVEERIQSLVDANRAGAKISVNIDQERWRLFLIEAYGQSQLSGSQLSNMKKCFFPSCQLTYVDLSKFARLQILNLMDNDLAVVQGLEHLHMLRVLNLSYNKRLKAEPIFTQLCKTPCTTLEHVFLWPDKKKPPTSGFVLRVLEALGPTNPKLAVIDGETIGVLGRVQVYRTVMKNVDQKVLDNFHANLALCMAATKIEGRNYNPTYIVEGVQYKAGLVNDLSRLTRCGLRSDMLDLSAFIRLQKLDLSYNRLTDLKRLGLERLQELRRLDLRYNQIDCPLTELGALIDSLRKLQVVSLRGNPCVSNFRRDRQRLMQEIPSLFNPETCQIRVIDTAITIEERVSAWAKRSQTQSKKSDKKAMETLRYKAALHIRAPNPEDIPPHEVTELDLSGLHLTTVDLNRYVKLEKLILRDNRILTLWGIGLDRMKGLRVLDLRQNRLTDMQEVLKYVNQLTKLEYIGLEGNRFPPSTAPAGRSSSQERWTGRDTFMMGAISLKKIDTCLCYLDKDRIQPDEIVDAWLAQGVDHAKCEMFRFQLAISTQWSKEDCLEKDVLSFDLQFFNLTHLALTPFTSLTRLDLSHNKLTVTNLRNSGICTLARLTSLDISYNLFRTPAGIGEILARIANLKELRLIGNGGFPTNSAQNRIRLLSSIPTIDQAKMPLQKLEDQEITIEERVQSVRYRDRGQNFQSSTSPISPPSRVSSLSISPPSKIGNQSGRSGDWSDSLEMSRLRTESYGTTDGRVSPRSRDHLSIDMDATTRKRTESKDTKSRAEKAEETDHNAEFVRCLLTLERLKLSPDINSITLQSKSLVVLRPFAAYQKLETLNISNNKITTLRGQGLDELPLLSTLDIRHNDIRTIDDDIIIPLTRCHSLKYLYIELATTDGKTNKVDRNITKIVCGYLRGVKFLDGNMAPAEFLLSPLQFDAQAFLFQLAGIGVNGVVDVDLRNKNIPTEMFFFTLAALSELKTVEKLHVKGNGWDHDSSRIFNYRQYIIAALGEGLKYLDGDRVVDGERLLAFRKLGHEDKFLLVWEECKEKAYLSLKQFNPKLKLPEIIGSSQNNKHGIDNKKAADQEFGPGFYTFNLSPNSNGPTPKTPNDGRVDTVRSGAEFGEIRAEEIVRTMTGTVINKLEIIINYLQIYALVLILDVNIPWPDAFLQMSQWVKGFSFDIDIWFNIDLPYQQQTKFAIIIMLPTVFLLFYLGLAKVNKEAWIKSYITQWHTTKWRAFAIFMSVCVISICMIFATDPGSLKGHPSGVSGTILEVVLPFSLLYYALWYWVINTFRKHFICDKTTRKTEFFEWWLDRILWFRRMCLFIVTIIFMPVSRVIVSQFSCWCPLDEGPEGIAAAPVDSDGNKILTCQSRVIPGDPCFPDRVTALQVCALLFGICYILGVPIFFYNLIKQGVHSMIDIQGYLALQRQTNKETESLKASLDSNTLPKEHIKIVKQRMAFLQEELHRFYYNKATINKLPQTYLYAPYQRKFRFWKLFQMAQKLLILIITMFVPRAFPQLKVVCANVVIWAWALTSIFSRPFSDRIEDIMEVISQTASTCNVFVALGLTANFIGQSAAAGILVLVNLGALLSFILSFLLAPLHYCCIVYRYKSALQAFRANEPLLSNLRAPSPISLSNLNHQEPDIEQGDGVSKALATPLSDDSLHGAGQAVLSGAKVSENAALYAVAAGQVASQDPYAGQAVILGAQIVADAWNPHKEAYKKPAKEIVDSPLLPETNSDPDLTSKTLQLEEGRK